MAVLNYYVRIDGIYIHSYTQPLVLSRHAQVWKEEKMKQKWFVDCYNRKKYLIVHLDQQ